MCLPYSYIDGTLYGEVTSRMKVTSFHSNGAEIYAREYGRGEPLVMIHGACVDSDFFADTAVLLGRGFDVYTYDRRGYGRSENGTEDRSVAAQAKDAAALIQKIGVPCHIVAHSGGTAIAMELGKQHPELVRRIVLHEPVDAGCRDERSETARTLREIGEIIRAGKYNKAMCQFLPLLGERDPRAREATEDELAHMGQNCRCFAEHEFFEVFSYTADADALRGMSVSIGLGEDSRGTHREMAAKGLAEKLSAPLIAFPGGHNCAFDLPQEFAWLVCGILRD